MGKITQFDIITQAQASFFLNKYVLVSPKGTFYAGIRIFPPR